MQSPSDNLPRDAWWNEPARDFLIALADRGIEHTVKLGRLWLSPADRLTRDDEGFIRQHRDDLVLLSIACDLRVLERLHLPESLEPPARGLCRICGDTLPADVRAGSCGWCAIAQRHRRLAPLTLDLLGLLPLTVVGPRPRSVTTDAVIPESRRGLPFAGVA
jgi:hypothetical protein